jgi:hypothetical protein
MKTKNQDKPVAPAPEAAREVGVTEYLVRQAIALGQIETVKIGKRELVKMSSLRKLVGAA